MARPKKASKAKKQAPKDPRVEETYEEEVEFICPVRGKIRQKVKIKRFKSLIPDSRTIVSSKSEIDAIEEKDDGLAMFGGEEEPAEN